MEHLASTLLLRNDTDIDLYKVIVFPHQQNAGPFEGFLYLALLKM